MDVARGRAKYIIQSWAKHRVAAGNESVDWLMVNRHLLSIKADRMLLVRVLSVSIVQVDCHNHKYY